MSEAPSPDEIDAELELAIMGYDRREAHAVVARDPARLHFQPMLVEHFLDKCRSGRGLTATTAADISEATTRRLYDSAT